MCMVCSTCKESRSFLNGNRSDDFKHQLYANDKRVSLTLCYIHSRDLYLMGERRFLTVYEDFARKMNSDNPDDKIDDLF